MTLTKPRCTALYCLSCFLVCVCRYDASVWYLAVAASIIGFTLCTYSSSLFKLGFVMAAPMRSTLARSSWSTPSASSRLLMDSAMAGNYLLGTISMYSSRPMGLMQLPTHPMRYICSAMTSQNSRLAVFLPLFQRCRWPPRGVSWPAASYL